MLEIFLKDSIDSMLNVSGLASYDEGFRSKVRSQQLADMDDMLTWPSEKMSIQTTALGEGATEVGEVESASPWLSGTLEAEISLLTAF